MGALLLMDTRGQSLAPMMGDTLHTHIVSAQCCAVEVGAINDCNSQSARLFHPVITAVDCAFASVFFSSQHTIATAYKASASASIASQLTAVIDESSRCPNLLGQGVAQNMTAAAALRQGLRQQQQQQVLTSVDALFAQLAAAAAAAWSDGGSFTQAEAATTLRAAAPAVSKLVQPLREFAAAVAAALPSEACCNNPECRELRELSELELVGGKGNICKYCKVARY